MSQPFNLRPARPDDIPALEALIVRSARGLSTAYYTHEELEAAVKYVFGVDSELVADRSYFVVEVDGQPAACGGWSRRKTLFGGNQFAGREAGFLDPATDAAKIRAFFVDPGHARLGLGRALLAHCEAEAVRHGFIAAEMMATLPGVDFYRRCGYEGDETVLHKAPDGTEIRFVPMQKSLVPVR